MISGIGDHDPGTGDHDQRNTQRNQMKPIPPFIYGIFHALQAL
jgi:hypothetical protein